jgi:hypothetical protein
MKKLFLILLLLFPLRISAQDSFTTTSNSFSYLKDDGTWSDWSTIRHSFRIDFSEKPVVITVNTEIKDEILIQRRKGIFSGVFKPDGDKVSGSRYKGTAKTGEIVMIKIEYFGDGARGLLLVYPKYKYYYTNKY